MYDGAVFVVPEPSVAAGEAAIRTAFGQALREAKLVAGIKVVARPRWGEAPAGSTP